MLQHDVSDFMFSGKAFQILEPSDVRLLSLKVADLRAFTKISLGLHSS